MYFWPNFIFRSMKKVVHFNCYAIENSQICLVYTATFLFYYYKFVGIFGKLSLYIIHNSGPAVRRKKANIAMKLLTQHNSLSIHPAKHKLGLGERTNCWPLNETCLHAAREAFWILNNKLIPSNNNKKL